MTPIIRPSKALSTSWTLGRSGHTLTCALIQKASGTYLLRVRHEGRCILDEHCEGPQEAIARSLEAFHVFVARGWLPQNSAN